MAFVALALMLLFLAGPAQAQDASNPIVVQIGVFNVGQDGAVGGYAVDVPERVNEPFSSLVWTGAGGCRIGAIDLDRVDREPPDAAADAWELQGRVTAMTADQASVQLEWRRVRAAGAAVESAWSQKHVTLPLNELVALDAPVQASGDCARQSVTFGARFTARFRPTASRGGGAGTSGTGSATSGAGSARALRVASGASLPAYDGEMWLVHNVPGKPDSHLQTTLHVAGGWTPFTFPPIDLTVPGGTLTVAINGSLRIIRSGESGRAYVLTGNRAVTYAPATPPGRDPADTRSDRASFSISRALPGPDDVVAYEMPAVNVPGGSAVQDRFTIRLRLRPVTGRD